ncbi:hypothetical protein Y900_027505 [Mycolicibacterium aromaticivorans JS19b1 = JCM 16368]|uniref:P-type ATPase A domain-containing protein n=1 Tax=Mycolicibacterium aromaticivorans JS19b1 = JCM 16368 TaxID=1440774 RepID=A0A064CE91_9MYCO|nr:heavy metal translocating P-type ATPase [Mycolicibacterium aromaticivorans]KDE97043.1 hypothetical protein Y900_027505 [Mycolicibacterium aromaticivorans JS19b1 = JCM 16368]
MTAEVELDLPIVLPDALDRRDLCVGRLIDTLTGAPGLDRVHVVEASESSPARLCMHYDPDAVSVAKIRDLAESTGVLLTEQFGHVLWTVSGVSHIRRARTVADALRGLHGVVEAEVTPGLVRVEFDGTRIEEATIRGALAGMGVREADHDQAGARPGTGLFGERTELVFAIASVVVWTIGFVLQVSASDSEVTWLFVVAGILGGFFTIREAYQGVRNRRFEIDQLMLVAAGGAVVLGKVEEGALLLALFSIGHALEGYAMGRARRAVAALAQLAPSSAVVRDGDRERTVGVAELRVGDVVVVKPNERIAADGFVLAGTSSVDQAPLTGESIPVDKRPVADAAVAAGEPERVPASSRLFAGTINGSGQLDLQVTRPSSQSTLSKLAAMVAEANTQASPTQRFTDRFERVFVPAVLTLVGVVLLAGPLVGSAWQESLYRAMAVLVAASPCALAIATPSAVLAAVASAGRLGVLIKGGGPLENLGTVTAMAFDKTGTLTEGRPRLTDVVAAPGVDPQELLAVAVAVESLSDHPLAAAIVRDAAERLTAAALPSAAGVTSLTGRGVQATVNGAPVLIGNTALFAADGGVDPAVAATVDALRLRGRTTMIVKRDDRFLGVLGLMDRPRPQAADALTELRSMGVRRTVMLSGDHQLVADSIAREVGLTEAWGDLLPADKVTAIERLRYEEGKVAMVGDGVNDAPALAHATVGIAMGAAGSDVALETADVALMSDDLARLPVVMALSRKASAVIRQNLYISLGMVGFLIPATLIGFLGIGPAVVFHEGSTLIVVANALRLLAYRERPHRAPQPPPTGYAPP